MNETRFFELLAKKRATELTLPEHKELLDAARDNPEFARILSEIDGLYSTPIYDTTEEERESLSRARSQLFSKLQTQDTEPLHEGSSIKRSIFRWRTLFIATAAAAILLFVSTRFINYINPDQTSKENIVFTKKGSRTNLILPDGSQVWLNADSKISYSSTFGRQSRELTLEGEAYFDIVKDPANPFTIHTRDLDIRVLGTAFNVRTYPGEKQTEATLVRGIIEATLNGYEGKKVLLKPFEKISVTSVVRDQNTEKDFIGRDSFFTLKKISSMEPDSTIAETMWLKNKMVFKKAALFQIAEELERRYGVAIVITSQKLREKEFSGVFHDKELLDVLESLHLAGGFNYSVENKIVTIYP